MKLTHTPKKTPLAAAISAAVFCLSSTAFAQQVDNASAAEVEEALAIEEIVVSGIRKSLEAALDVKRDASSIVDAINAEDIGKFPDKNIADSLQRIPGVSVDRIWGEGRDIFVRGTDKTLNRTFMNGQNVSSAYWWANDNPGRGFNYSILASELISSLEVYKSPEADLDEGSIGGSVNVKTRRPMDLDAWTIHGSVESQYSELPDQNDPQYSGLVSWKNDDETFGVLVSYTSQDRTVRRDGLEAFPYDATHTVTDQDGNVTEDVYAVWGGGSAIFSQERERATTNVTLQFRPNDAWDIAVNYVDSDMTMDNNNQNYLFMPGGFSLDGSGGRTPDTVTNPRFITASDGNPILMGGTFENDSNITRAGAAIEPIFRDAYVQSSVFDLDANYLGDGFTVHLQAGLTDAVGGSKRDMGYWFEAPTRTTLNLDKNIVEIQYHDLDPNDASVLTMASARDWKRKMEDEESYLQGDITFDVNWQMVHELKFGLKHRDHTIENQRTAGSTDSSHPNWRVISMDEVSNSLTPTLHGESATAGSLVSYAQVDNNLAQSVIDPMLASGVMTYVFDERAYYELNEKITAAYVKASFEQGNLRGNVGVRAVQTDQTSTGYIDGSLGDISRDYTDYLPSLNVVYQFSDDLLFRGAISKAMARPTFQNLSANITIDATNGSATAGNPELEPYYANQFEAGLEWYFQDAALLSATYFKKELDTFIFSRASQEVIDGDTLSVTRPFNHDEGADIQGIEVQWQQELAYGFGVVANYTWTDASVPSIDNGADLELPGNSEDQFNGSVYYENDQFSARLSYNYRSESFGAQTSGSQIQTDAYDQWDATLNWNATDNIDVFATAVNITNEIIYQSTTDGIPVGYYENGARYSVGVRAKF